MKTELDTTVEAFRTRPLDAGPYTFMAADALVLKVREGGRVVNVHALIASGSTKLCVPTWSVLAPARKNSMASVASWMPPMPEMGSGTPARRTW